MILAGGNPETITLEDAQDICWMMVTTGRYIRPDKWVTTLAEKAEQEGLDNALNGMM